MEYLIMGISALLPAKLYEKKRKCIYLILSILPFFIVSAARLGIGSDYKNYEYTFYRTWSNGNLEYGYSLLQTVVRNIFGEYRWMIIITSLIFLLIMYWAIGKYSYRFSYSIFLLISSTIYFESLCHIRFMIGVSLVLYSYRYINERKLWSFIITLVIAVGFHKACILGLILYFLYGKKLKWYVIPGCVIALSSIFLLLPSLVNMIEMFSDYTSYLSGERTQFLEGLCFLQTSIYVFYLFVTKTYKVKGEEAEFYTNVQLIVCLVAVFSAVIPLAGRIATLLSVYQLLSLPYFIGSIRGKGKHIIKFAISVAFIAYCYYSIVLNLGFGVYPYVSIWS